MLFEPTQNLFERVCSLEVLRESFRAVKRNKGAPGVDGVTISDFEKHLDKELTQLLTELTSWSYCPKPVRRVEIPKPGTNSGIRRLGIPCVRDRVVQASIKIVLETLFEPIFSDKSYGFRPKRNQQQAVEEAQRYVQAGKSWVVDLDLAAFFDSIHHDRLISRLGEVVHDKRILRLIGLTLRSGVMINGVMHATDEGSVQGSPLSPLLSNVVLDELDKELEKRQLSFVRFADDANIFVRSKEAAERVMKSITLFIEKRLRLTVNREKSKVALSSHVKFLGMTIINGQIAIARKSMARAMEKVKELTPRGTHFPLEKAIGHINMWYRGWSSYFSMSQFPMQFAVLEAHIRRRLRARIVRQQKKRRHLYRKLVQRGIKRHAAARCAYARCKWWYLSHMLAVERAYPNKWFIEYMGQLIISRKNLEHWNSVKVRVQLP